MSLDEWQDQCVRLALSIKEWANYLELRIASIEYRLDRLEDRHGHQTVESQHKELSDRKRVIGYKTHELRKQK